MKHWDTRMTLAALAFGYLSGVGTNVVSHTYNSLWTTGQLMQPQPARYAVQLVHYNQALERDLHSLKTFVPFSSLVSGPDKPQPPADRNVRYAVRDAEADE